MIQFESELQDDIIIYPSWLPVVFVVKKMKAGLLKIIAIIGALISFGLMFWTSFSNTFT